VESSLSGEEVDELPAEGVRWDMRGGDAEQIELAVIVAEGGEPAAADRAAEEMHTNLPVAHIAAGKVRGLSRGPINLGNAACTDNKLVDREAKESVSEANQSGVGRVRAADEVVVRKVGKKVDEELPGANIAQEHDEDGRNQ